MPHSEMGTSRIESEPVTAELTEHDHRLIKELVQKLEADEIIQSKDAEQIERTVCAVLVQVGEIVPLTLGSRELKSRQGETVQIYRPWDATKGEPGEPELLYGARTINYSENTEYYRLTQVPAERVARGEG